MFVFYVYLLFPFDSSWMQVPTSQQKDGIYDVPKRHFMTVGVINSSDYLSPSPQPSPLSSTGKPLCETLEGNPEA